MSTAVRISYDEFEAMIARGDFAVDDSRRYELIDGEIVEMPPPGPAHTDADERLAKWSYRNLPEGRARIRTQCPIGLPELDGMPVPDVIWFRDRDYTGQRILAADVYLVIEISDSSLSYDRNTKARLYAAADLSDYWIANIPGRCFEVHRDPGPDGYATKLIFTPGDVIRPLALPDLAFPVSLIFPE